MIQESGIYNCFTKNHIPVVFFTKPSDPVDYDVQQNQSPYLYLYASASSPSTSASAAAVSTGTPSNPPATVSMRSYEISPIKPVSREFNREIDFLSSLGLCAVETKDDTTRYHIHVFAELFYGPNKLFRLFKTNLSLNGAELVFADMRQLLYRYVLPGKYLSYRGQKSEIPVELTYIEGAIKTLADELK